MLILAFTVVVYQGKLKQNVLYLTTSCHLIFLEQIDLGKE